MPGSRRFATCCTSKLNSPSPKLAALAKHGRPFSQNVMRSSIEWSPPCPCHHKLVSILRPSPRIQRKAENCQEIPTTHQEHPHENLPTCDPFPSHACAIIVGSRRVPMACPPRLLRAALRGRAARGCSADHRPSCARRHGHRGTANLPARMERLPKRRLSFGKHRQPRAGIAMAFAGRSQTGQRPRQFPDHRPGGGPHPVSTDSGCRSRKFLPSSPQCFRRARRWMSG